MLYLTLWTVGALLLASPLTAQNVSLYPTIDPFSLAQALNISLDCLDAL